MRNRNASYMFVIVLLGKWLDFRVKQESDMWAPRIFRFSLFQPLLALLWLECNRFFCFYVEMQPVSALVPSLSDRWHDIMGCALIRQQMLSGKPSEELSHLIFRTQHANTCTPVLAHRKASKQHTNTCHYTVLIRISDLQRLMWFLLGHMTPYICAATFPVTSHLSSSHPSRSGAEKFSLFCCHPHIYLHKQELWRGQDAKQLFYSFNKTLDWYVAFSCHGTSFYKM